ncbi:MAG: hypothetical protein Q8Q38_01125, partial [bacterium]|nr:hypothetical protein [bacterium]
IQNIFGSTTAEAEIPGRYLLPGRTRAIPIEALGDDSFFARNFRFGIYSATILLSVPGSDVPLVDTITFWAFPWKTAFVALWLVVLFIFFRKRIWAAGRVLVKKRA